MGMIRTIRTDLWVSRRNALFAAAIVPIYLAIEIAIGSHTRTAFLAGAIMSFASAFTASIERQCGWDCFGVAVGARREDIVRSKLVMIAVFASVGLAMGTAVDVFIDWGFQGDAPSAAAYTAMCYMLAISVGTATLLLTDWFEDDAGFARRFLMIFAIIMIIFAGNNLCDSLRGGPAPDILSVAVLSLVLSAALYWLYRRRYLRRDLDRWRAPSAYPEPHSHAFGHIGAPCLGLLAYRSAHHRDGHVPDDVPAFLYECDDSGVGVVPE